MSSNTTEIAYELFQASDYYFQSSLFYGGRTSAESIRRAFLEQHYAKVFTFRLAGGFSLEQSLEEVFRLSQNIDQSWNKHEECRSTSVGDLVRVGSQLWVVASSGFDLLMESNQLISECVYCHKQINLLQYPNEDSF